MMNLEEVIKRLKEPFPFSEMECKIQATNSDKTKGLAVFYIDSRAIQNRLDEIVGPFNWRNEYMLWQGNSQICGISIYDHERGIWVTKYDGAENTDYEPVKGGLSDSLKRAAVMWGLGRYLYNIDGLWVAIEQKGKSSYIKDSEKQRLQAHYNKFIGKPASDEGSLAKQKPTAKSTDKGQGSVGTAEYDYKVQSSKPSGNSTCLQLINKDGKSLTAYVKKDSPGLEPGALIKNVQMDERQNNDWVYYMLNKYEVAA